MPTLAFSGISTPGANTKTADLAAGSLRFVRPKTVVTLVAKGSAAGINATLLVGGIPVINDMPITMFGTSGTMSVNDNVVASALTAGGMIELYLRNTTATAGTTCDYAVYVN